MELPYDPAIPLLGIHPDKTVTCKDTCTPVFIAALFTIARTRKLPISPSTDEWIKNMDYYLAIKRNKFEPVLVRKMNLEPVYKQK